MSNIALPDAAGKVDTFTRTEGPDTVHMQSVVPVDPASGNPLDLATQTTLAALATAVGTLNAAAAAIQAAVEALNTKTSAVNTGAIAGTVALDAPSLAALETISINGTVPVSGPLTDAQIRATPLPVSGTVALDVPSLAALETISITGTVPISAAGLPLPADAASETTLSAVNAKLPALSAGRVPVELPSGGGGLTDSELRASAVPVSVAALPLPAGAATEATLLVTTKQKNSASSVADYGQLMLAQRRDSDTAETTADGQYTSLKQDESGRLKVATQPGAIAATVANITASAQTIAVNVERASNITISMVATSLVGHNITFEYSNNSTNGTDGNWYVVQVVRSNANTVETASGVLAATPAYGWEASVNAYKWFRVRATAHTSGTAAYTLLPGSYATEPIPAVQVTGTQPVSGSVTATLAAATVRAGFLAGAGIWYDDSSTNLGASATFTGTSRDLTVTATATAFANAATYGKELRVSAESDVTGTLWLEISRDNTNWRRVKSVATSAVAGGGFFAEIIYRPSWRYARVGYTNGAGAQARFSIGSIAVAL